MMLATPNKQQPKPDELANPRHRVALVAWDHAKQRAADWWAAQPARQLAELNDALTKLEEAHAADR